MTHMLLYVDDIILITLSHDLLKSIMTLIVSNFSIHDLGPLSYFLGIFVKRHVVKAPMLVTSLHMLE